MTIKLTLLKTGETIISEMQELVAKGQEKEQTMPNAYLVKEVFDLMSPSKPKRQFYQNMNYGIVSWGVR